MSHLPQAGGDPEQFQLRAHSMPKAATKLPAASSTPPASNSKAPIAVPCPSLPSTSLPIEITAPILTVPDYGGNNRREAEAIISNEWPQPTEFRSWKISFNSEVSHSSQFPRHAMLWIGEVEDAESVDDLISSASFTGKSILDFENLDFKIASGLRKIVRGNLKKQVTTVEGKAQSEKSSLTDRQIAWMIYDLFEISGNNEAILDFRHLTKKQLKSDNVQAFDAKWDEVLSAVTDRPTDSKLESLYKMRVGKSKELKYVLQVHDEETTFGDKKCDNCRLKLMARRRVEQKIKESHLKARNRDEDRPAIGAPSKGTAKGESKEHAKNNSERGDCIRWITKGQCSFGDSCAFKPEPNKKGKGKGRPRSPSPTGSPHRKSKGDGKGSDDGGSKGTPKFSGKRPSGKANRPLCINFKKRICEKGNSCNYWHIHECAK